MKKYFILYTIYFIPVFSQAQVQNLVPNPSFEQYNTCPVNNGPISYLYHWFAGYDPQTSDGITGYYNQCAPIGPNNLSVPYNDIGYQQAHTGVAYAASFEGVHPVSSSDSGISWHGYTRGYINVKLRRNTQSGQHYCVTFFVSLADSSFYASKNLGMLFTSYPDTIHTNTPWPPKPIFANPQVVDTNFISDKINWVPVQGVFIADSIYSYICIGDFSKDTSMLNIPGGSMSRPYWHYSMYYIDDVSVIELPFQAAGSNTTICAGDSTQIGSAADSNFTYKWFPEEGLRLKDSTNTQPWVKPTQTTIYYLTVQDSAGCSTTDSVVITICQTEIQIPTIQIPNIITPNNDGKNDAFYIGNLPEQSNLTIFNRWGKTVYHSLNYQNNWEAADVVSGTYYYLLTLPDGTLKKGFLEIIK